MVAYKEAKELAEKGFDQLVLSGVCGIHQRLSPLWRSISPKSFADGRSGGVY